MGPGSESESEAGAAESSRAPSLQAPDPELPILPAPHPPVLADDHRRHGFAALNRRDVEALDAPRQRRQREHVLQRLERVVLRRLRLVEARLVGERGVAVGEIDEAALLAALRHDDPHAPAGALGQPALERLALVRLGRHVDLRRRAAQLVELLDRRLEHFAVARRRQSPPRCRARRARRRGRCAPGRPGWRRRPGRASGRTRRDGRAPRSPSSAGDRAASARCAARRAAAPPPRTARLARRPASGPQGLDQLVVLALEKQLGQLDRARRTPPASRWCRRTARCTA